MRQKKKPKPSQNYLILEKKPWPTSRTIFRTTPDSVTRAPFGEQRASKAMVTRTKSSISGH